MGQLLLLHESFEFTDIAVNMRERVIGDFFAMVDKANGDKDVLMMRDDFYSYVYSYGNFFQFCYAPWNKNDHTAIGISQKLHQLFSQYWEWGHYKKITHNEFLKITGHKGYMGFDGYVESLSPYIKCIQTWRDWKTVWYANNPEYILWDEDEFLPNRQYSNELLREELKKNGIPCHDNTQSARLFYERIMNNSGLNGGERLDYIRHMGRRICEANFYTYDVEVSNKNKTKDHLRYIFAIIRSGKKQYISLDFEKGMFEYHDHQGTHLGEYRFDGTQHNPPKATHDIHV